MSFRRIADAVAVEPIADAEALHTVFVAAVVKHWAETGQLHLTIGHLNDYVDAEFGFAADALLRGLSLDGNASDFTVGFVEQMRLGMARA